MEISGKIIVLNDTQTISEKFRKREFVVEIAENPQYPQTVLFQFTQDKCELLDSVQVGDSVAVSFNLRGRKWTSPGGEVKYFNTLEAWRIEKKGHANPARPKATPQTIEPEELVEDSDLPF